MSGTLPVTMEMLRDSQVIEDAVNRALAQAVENVIRDAKGDWLHGPVAPPILGPPAPEMCHECGGETPGYQPRTKYRWPFEVTT